MFVFLCYAVTLQPPPSIPHTPRSSESKEEMNKVGREWGSTYGGEVKPTTSLISQSWASVMEVQHSKLIPFLSWAYTCPFTPSILCSLNVSPFSQHVIQLPIVPPWLFTTDMLEVDDEEAEPEEREGGRGRDWPALPSIYLFSSGEKQFDLAY